MRRLISIGIAGALAGVVLAIPHAQTTTTGTLDRILASSRIKLGYRIDARPFAFRDDAGKPDGYSITLCMKVADDVQSELRLPKLTVQWVPVTAVDRFVAVQQHTVDILCGADTVSLSRRKILAFSIPIFPGGVGVMLRSDAPARLKNVLNGRGQAYRPTWRAAASEILQFRAFSAVSNTSAESWLRERIDDLKVRTTVSPVASYPAGVDAVLARRSDALFGERAILLDAARHHANAANLVVLDRLFTYEPLALTLPANDEPFRWLVDRTLTQFYSAGSMSGLYAKWFGEPDDAAITFFRWNALPD